MSTFNNLYNELLTEISLNLNRYVYDGDNELRIYSRVIKPYLDQKKLLFIDHFEEWPDGLEEASVEWWVISCANECSDIFMLRPTNTKEVSVSFTVNTDYTTAESLFFQGWIDHGVDELTIELKMSEGGPNGPEPYYLVRPRLRIEGEPILKIFGV